MKRLLLSLILPSYFLTPFAHARLSAQRAATTGRKDLKAAQSYSESAFDWIDCHDYMDHLDNIARFAGTKSPKRAPGYSKKTCRKVFEAAKKHELVDSIVNLSEHVRGRQLKDLRSDETVLDVAGAHRRRLDTCSNDYGQSSPGVHNDDSNTQDATAIEACPSPLGDQCSELPPPCIPEFLQSDVGRETQSYEHSVPAYGGNAQYSAFTASISGTAFWNGCDRDRTNADAVGGLLIGIITANFAILLAESLCEAAPDDVEIVIPFTPIAIDLPNPGKVICAAIVAGLKLANLAITTIYEQVNYQDGLVNGAEIEAAYEHTKNLLTKQCAIFDQVICRCTPTERLGFGQGCDGKDSNCDDVIDDCREDVIPPEITIHGAIGLCGNKNIWFKNNEDALKCVSENTVVTDDCQQTSTDVVYQEGDCEATIVNVTAKEDTCENQSSETVRVQVDGTSPVVSCTFNGDTESEIWTTGPGVFNNVNFGYTASDNCGLPLNATVDVYANEVEDFNAQEMALFFNPNGDSHLPGLYVGAAICSTDNNGQCIKDPNAPDIRLYTAIISATDQAGNSASNECRLRVVGNETATASAASTQRFHLTGYKFTLQDY